MAANSVFRARQKLKWALAILTSPQLRNNACSSLTQEKIVLFSNTWCFSPNIKHIEHGGPEIEQAAWLYIIREQSVLLEWLWTWRQERCGNAFNFEGSRSPKSERCSPHLPWHCLCYQLRGQVWRFDHLTIDASHSNYLDLLESESIMLNTGAAWYRAMSTLSKD